MSLSHKVTINGVHQFQFNRAVSRQLRKLRRDGKKWVGLIATDHHVKVAADWCGGMSECAIDLLN